MVNRKENNEFKPTVAIAPGATIKENMVSLKMTQNELALRLNLTPKHLSNMINGKEPITYESAVKLENVFGISAEFWMNLEVNFQLTKARLKQESDLEAEGKLLKHIPYKNLSDLGWVEKTKAQMEKIINLRNFFGVSSLLSIEPLMELIMFRTHNPLKGVSNYGVLAWLRKAEVEAEAIKVCKLNKSKLKQKIDYFKMLTLKDPNEFLDDLINTCAQCGVALVLVPAPARSYICGATFWRQDKVVLALSARGKRADTFWFTFFHELAHLLAHSKRVNHFSFDEMEHEADDIASNYLIPNDLYQAFIKESNYEDHAAIIAFAKQLNIAPYIIVGRLRYDKLIDYKMHHALIPTYDFFA